MNQITTINSIRQISKEQWDALTDANIFASHGWLLTVEESLLKQVTPTYFLYKENGRLSGAAVCYPADNNMNDFSPDNLLFGRLNFFFNRLRLSFIPTLVCGTLKAYGNHILLEKNTELPKRERIVAKILDAIEAEAKKRRLSVSFRRALQQETILFRQLRQRGYFKTADLPQAYLDISWDSFDGYKNFIRKRSPGMKKNISHEINKNRKSGVVIEEVRDFNGQEKNFYDLLNENNIKHNKIPMAFQKDFLNRLKKNCGEDLVIYRSLKQGKLSGVGILLKNKKTGSVAFSGINRQLAQNDATFFNMLFYRPITDAIAKNIQRLYYGNAMYDMKIKRGCKIEKAFFFHKPRHLFFRPAVSLWFYFHRLWYQKKLPQSFDLADNLK